MKRLSHFEEIKKYFNVTSVDELPRYITKNLTEGEMAELRASKYPYRAYHFLMARRCGRVDGPSQRKNVKPKEPSHRITIWGEDYLIFERLSECAKVSMQNLMHQIARHMKERNPKIFCTYSKEQK